MIRSTAATVTTAVLPTAALVAVVCATAAVGPPSLHAQETRTVRGAVVDAETGRPVDGVLVRATGTEDRALTDARGAFRLDAVPAGPRTFVLDSISSFMDRDTFGRYWSSPETNLPRVAGLEKMR